MHRCHIALGGNLGDVRQTFLSALRSLAGPGSHVATVSRLYATPPMGSQAGGTFLNAAAALDTELSPVALLDRLLSIESELGRERSLHWGPRRIDLDLILYGNEIIDLPQLRVPHPGCWHRRFVLDPLAEIAPGAIHPETRETIAALQSRLLECPLAVAFEPNRSDLIAVAEEMQRRFAGTIWTGSDRAALTFRPGVAGSSAIERWIGVPDDPQGLRDSVAAALTAALGLPEPVEALTFNS